LILLAAACNVVDSLVRASIVCVGQGTIVFIGAGEEAQVRSRESGIQLTRASANQSAHGEAYKLTC
jgi:hypothetical protein